MLADERGPVVDDQLAMTLVRLAGNESVRVLEALAAVLVTRGERGRDATDGEGGGNGLEEAAAPWVGEADPRLQLCRRIARRALRHSLIDPTRGATAFHRIDVDPAWARRRMPVAVFGPFLFYRT